MFGHASYYRHEKDEISTICPAKRSCLQSKTSSSSAQPPLSGGSRSDSTFDFGSSNQSIYEFEAARSGGDCEDDFVSVITRSNDLFQSNTGEYGYFFISRRQWMWQHLISFITSLAILLRLTLLKKVFTLFSSAVFTWNQSKC